MHIIVGVERCIHLIILIRIMQLLQKHSEFIGLIPRVFRGQQELQEDEGGRTETEEQSAPDKKSWAKVRLMVEKCK